MYLHCKAWRIEKAHSLHQINRIASNIWLIFMMRWLLLRVQPRKLESVYL